MTHRLRLPCKASQIPQPLPVETNKDGGLTTQSVAQINTHMQTVAAALNGNISFGDGTLSEHTGNIDGQTIVVKMPLIADTEIVVPHGLERVPTGRIVIGQNAPGHLYDSNRGGWGIDKIYLKCDSPSVTFTLALI
jgi:hypothetical protein